MDLVYLLGNRVRNPIFSGQGSESFRLLKLRNQCGFLFCGRSSELLDCGINFVFESGHLHTELLLNVFLVGASAAHDVLINYDNNRLDLKYIVYSLA